MDKGMSARRPSFASGRALAATVVLTFAFALVMGVIVAPARARAATVETIASTDDLRAFAESVNAGETYEGQTVTLAADLDLTGRAWVPVGTLVATSGTSGSQTVGGTADVDPNDLFDVSQSAVFRGTFEGDGHTVTGLASENIAEGSANEDTLALFNVLGRGGTVRGLCVVGDLKGTNAVAGVVAVSLGTVESCSFSGSISSDEKDAAVFYGAGLSGSGGVVGVNLGTVTSCLTVEGSTVTRGGANCGGIAGVNFGTVRDCANSASIFSKASEYPGLYTASGAAGGICGTSRTAAFAASSTSSTTPTVSVSGCTNTGNVSCLSNYTGGIVGNVADALVTDCTNSGTISAQGKWEGGIVGSVMQMSELDSSVTNCTNTGTVEGVAVDAGGIAGAIARGPGSYATNRLSLSDCLNTGSVSGGNQVGGVVGRTEAVLRRDFNTGSVTGSGSGASSLRNPDCVGGVAGSCPASAEDCGNSGDVRYTQSDVLLGASVGGVAGDGYATGSFVRCYSLGRVLIDAEVDFVSEDVYPGGVVGRAEPGAVLGCFYCAERAGDATSLNPSVTDSATGTPLRDMLGRAALSGMARLFGNDATAVEADALATAADENTAWTAAETILPAAPNVMMSSPYLATAGSTDAPMTATTIQIAVACHTVSLPAGDGYSLTATDSDTGLSAASGEAGAGGSLAVYEGDDVVLAVAVADGYGGSGLSVSANGTPLTPQDDGSYLVSGIREDQTIVVSGVTRPAADDAADGTTTPTMPTSPVSSANASVAVKRTPDTGDKGTDAATVAALAFLGLACLAGATHVARQP